MGFSFSSHNESSTWDVPDVPLDSGSSKESRIKELCPTKDSLEEDNNPNIIDRIQDISFIQDAFIFCPMLESFVLNETMVQGIFASEREMNQMECTRNSIFNRFITIAFDEKDVKRSKVQKDNAREYNSALYVEGIFSYKNDAPIENWLFNSVENLKEQRLIYL